MNEAAAKVLSDGGVMEIPSVVTSVAAMCTTNDATTTTNTSSSSSNVDYMSILESWIGLSPTSTSTTNNMTRTGTTFTSSSITSAAVESEMLLMEDMAPFEIQFYQSVVELLIQVWKPTNNNNENYYDGVVFSGGVTTMRQQLHNNNNNKQSLMTSNNNNVLFVEKSSSPSTTTKDKDDDDDVISLYDVMESVRVTRLLRYWMDLNVQGGQTMAEESSKTLIDYLLETQQQSSTSSTQSSSSPLIQALYYHIRELPQLQSQIHVYTQSLMRGGGSGGHPGSDHTIVSSSNTGHQQQPFNPKSRLQQYQHAQQVSSKLNSEWEDHLQSLEQIVSDVYSNGDTNQRKQCRSLLGSVWSQFVSRSASSTSGGGGSSSSSAVKMENTSSSGIQMTLRVLHRILLGIKKPTIAYATTTTTTATNSNLLLLPKSYEHLLTYHLIPLHKPNSMVLWRDQTSLLELYHEPLVQCIAILLQKKPDLIPKVIGSLLEPDIWTKGGNTPKLVLLLHEIDTYIGIIPTTTTETTDTDDDMMNTSSSKKSSSSQTTTIVTTLPNMDNVVFPNLLKTLGICMSSDHSRLAERALSYMKNTKFQLLLEKNFERSMKILLPFLVRSEPAWNPTVRKMTWTVLKKFCDYDQATLVKVSNQYFPPPPPPSSSNSNNNNNNTTILPVPRPVVQGTAKNEIKQTHAAPPKDFTLKSAMGGWKPPSGSGGGVNRNSSGMMPPPPGRAARGGGRGRGGAGAGAAPPLAVTGVAPWAMNNQTSTMSLPSRTSKNPPLGVTGVAPWAMKQQSSTNNSNRTAGATQTTTKRSAGEALSLPGVVEEQGKRQHHQQTSSGGDSNNDKGYVPRVLSYMEEIKPPEQDEDGSSWSKVQMAETPTLLPNLKFHDLVFGHDLGEGAFGSVRYARLIDRMKTRSQWPEYAVKVISTEKIREMGYEASAQRELAILRVLSHPGIARLVSSFRFREGVYLVLEYASGGDIHSLLRRNGSIDNESTRFVIGEVIAALASIHELGLVYADLKPENIVITESGHIKLTDFGGCRPVTSEAKALINISAKNNTLHGLRDGDWKPQQKQQQRQQGNEESNGWSLMEVDNEDKCEDGNDDVTPMDVNNETADDLRIEGTTAYLPPEVVMGGFPTRSADSWALGCVLYQCLTGRPPILEADEALTKKRIVSFGDDSSSSPSSSQKKNDKAQLFEDSHAVHITAEARDLICSLLQQNPVERPSMNQAGQHDFFRLAGMDVFSLHRQPAHPLDVGDVSPVADAQWSRRQFSSIWAPQPQAYDISMTGLDDSNKQRRGDSWSGPIAEGDEATSFFSKIGSMSSSFGDNTTSLKIPLPTMAATSTIEEDKIATS